MAVERIRWTREAQRGARSLLAIVFFVLFASPRVFASDAPFFKGDVQGPPASQELPNIEKNVGIDQHLGHQVTLSLPVRDEHGNETTLGAYFGKRPVILVMSYYECPNLCTFVMNGVFGGLRPLNFIPGKDYEVVTVSINPSETPALALKKKDSYLAGYHEQQYADGFHFLTAGQSTIDQLTKEVGFRYAYDTEGHQYVHASGIMLLTPEGRLSRYFMGVRFVPNDLKFSLMDASGNKIGTLADKLVLYCCRWEPEQSKWGIAIGKMLFIGGILMILAIGLMYYLFYRRSRNLKRTRAEGMVAHV